LIGAKLIGGLCAIAGYAYYLRYRTSCYPDPGLNFHSFSRYFTFGRNITWIETTFAAPAMRHCGVCVGYFWLGMQAIVLWVAFDNVLLAQGIVSPIRAISEIGYHAFQSLVIAGLTMARFYASNYQRYASLSRPVFERAVVAANHAHESVLPR
jgi:hypothetical protein